jgi:dihydrofolate reductase
MATRQIVMFNQVSADGFFAAPDGNLDWVVQEPKVYQEAVGSLPQVDTMLFGRKTYDMFESFWPHALDDPKTAPDPHAPGKRSEQLRDMAVWINESPKLVISKSRKSVTWKNSKLLNSFDAKAIKAMKQEKGGDIMVFGSGSIVAQLSQHRLIDHYIFVVMPVLLGKGRSMLDSSDARLDVQLVKAKSFDSGVVLLHYGPK